MRRSMSSVRMTNRVPYSDASAPTSNCLKPAPQRTLLRPVASKNSFHTVFSWSASRCGRLVYTSTEAGGMENLS
ncbi:hypothetical protein DIPPA_20333 [Diplonema papillatum]|nr:hypothetical protein DIPPA_20333 [Diplonema papillatum]